MEMSDIIREATKSNERLKYFIESANGKELEKFQTWEYSLWLDKVKRWCHDEGVEGCVHQFTAGDLVIADHDLFTEACKYITEEGIKFEN